MTLSSGPRPPRDAGRKDRSGVQRDEPPNAARRLDSTAAVNTS